MDPKTTKFVIGAPVAERAWILTDWFNQIWGQTVKPSQFCFVYSDSKDKTRDSLLQGRDIAPVVIKDTVLPYHSRDKRNADKEDPWRAKHLAKLRNYLLTMFLQTDADVFISLDTDILLEDPTILEQLIQNIEPYVWDVVSPVTYLHVLEKQSRCYNAGVFWGGQLGSFDQGWKRIDYSEWLVYGNKASKMMKIDIPMAVVAMRRHVAAMCRYKAHECGEDIGFGQSLARNHFVAGLKTDLECRHVWGPSYLKEPAHV